MLSLNFALDDPVTLHNVAWADWHYQQTEGWTVTVILPVSGSLRLIAESSRLPAISRCDGVNACSVTIFNQVDLGVLHIQ